MKSDAVKQFVSLRNNLIAERDQLQSRLGEISRALGTTAGDVPAPFAPAPPRATKPGKRTMSDEARAKISEAQRLRWAERRTGNGAAKSQSAPANDGRSNGGITLREAVTKLTSAKPLTRKEIIAGLPSTGYKTKSKDPGNLLNQLIYGKNATFKKIGDGKYGPK